MWGQICYVQTFHWFILQVFSFVPKLQDILQTRLLKSQLEFPLVVLEMLKSFVWFLLFLLFLLRL